MIDIEALGLKPGSLITQVALVFFNAREPKTCQVFQYYPDPVEQQRLGATIDVETVRWWFDQKVKPFAEHYQLQHSVGAFFKELTDIGEYAEDNINVWANDPSYDVVLLKALADLAGRPWPAWMSHRQERSMRTLKWLRPGVPPVKPFVEHRAVDDATAQAAYVVNCLAELLGPVSPEGVRGDQTGPSATAGGDNATPTNF